ncbi:hypothetical protein PV04_09317 [Phialophora macrospora]|uniref:Heterokaryon incompatibility domain-containing protein n=1 Tax=Phialophora macrospora TaxID=1851006 RepID=A0A0D2F8N3_9EURO|nr:hypothetical protein PV04_09317 [Phialophora macrospora]
MGQKSSKVKKRDSKRLTPEASPAGHRSIVGNEPVSVPPSARAQQGRPASTAIQSPRRVQVPTSPVTPNETAALPQQGSTLYRSLARNEIRLLRILPPEKSSSEFDFAPDIVQCELLYESLDRIDAANAKASLAEASESRILDFLFQGLMSDDSENSRAMASVQQHLRKDMRKTDKEESVRFPLSTNRRAMLEQLYAQFQQRRAKWLPEGFNSWTGAESWDDWLRSWIWVPLSGHEECAELPTDGYFAVSYVCSDVQPSFYRDEFGHLLTHMAQAGGITLKQLLHDYRLPPDQLSDDPIQHPSTAQILVNGTVVEVGTSLDRALRTLREIPEVQLGKKVWVDALSINQADLVEKSHEVLNMGLIYGKAERVISYLGPEEDDSGDTLEVMSIMGEALLTEKDIPAITQWLFSNFDAELVLRMAQLLSRPYWSRIWIVQEIVLGNENAITICGARRFPTSQLLTLGARLFGATPELCVDRSFRLGHVPGGPSADMALKFFIEGLTKLRDLRQYQVNLPTMIDSSTYASTLWFRVASANYATDPRDMVYGMLNLLPRALVARLNVDYAQHNTYRRVMTDFAVANISSTNVLSWILHRPWCPFPGDQEWPSWVPNLALPFDSAQFWWTLGVQACSGYAGRIEFRFNTQTNFPTLQCDGFFIDVINQTTISHSSRRAQEASQELVSQVWNQAVVDLGLDLARERMRLWRVCKTTFSEPPAIPNLRLGSSPHHAYGTLAGLKAALAACFRHMNLFAVAEHESIFDVPLNLLETWEMDMPQVVAGQTAPTLNPTPLHFLQRVLKEFGLLDLWGLAFRNLFSQRPAAAAPVPELHSSERTVLISRLFTTCAGYVGAALCPLRAGDRIYVLPNCKMPVALRPSGKVRGAYELLGGLYIPGFMQGEMFQTPGARMRIEMVTLV